MTLAPDWSQQSDEVLCPLCEYNLRGLSEPRCPECGFQSDWRELTDPGRRQHPYLFEHHPRRNIWSFFQTMIHALRPRRFWKLLNPTQPVRMRRLILYWLIAASLALLVTMPQFALEISRVSAAHSAWRSTRRRPPFMQPREFAQYLDRLGPLPPSARFFRVLFRESSLVRAMSSALAIYLAWVPVAFATLMIFQTSLRHARIRPAHALRCTVYSGDCGVVLLGAIAFVGAIAIRQIVPIFSAYPIHELAWWAAMLVVWGGITFRLIRAYQLYLRFPNAL
ncbi:MAG TPA: hypothetical protein VGF52_04850, partial [Tepidisphaeraceae bacterium]